MNYPKRGSALLKILIVFSVILSISFGVYSFRKAVTTIKLPIIDQVGSFKLTDAKGEKFDSIKFYGKVWIANFFSTNCLDDCQQMTKRMADLSRTFEQIPEIRLASITLTPNIDTPPVLTNYSKQLVIGKGNWFFLTGSAEEINKLAYDQLKIDRLAPDKNYSSQITLVDRSGLIRGYYDGSRQESINQLFIDASRLLKDRF